MQDQRAIELSLANLPARRRALFTILAVALGLRLLHLWSVLPVELGQPPEVGMDRWLNTHIAEAVTGRKWLGGWSAAYDSSPGYSYLLAALYWFSGRNWLGPLLVQSLLGACAPLCLYALGRRLFSVSVGIVAATFAALFSPTIFYEALLVKFAFVPITVACALLCLVRALEPGADASAVGAGLTLGVLALLRPNGGIVAPTMLLWLAVSRRRHGFPDIRRPLLLVAAGMAIVMVPMLIRDRIAAAHGLESSLWGIHFYIGTNPDADGTYVSVPGVREDILGHVDDARQVAENASGHALTPSEVSAFWFHRGLSFISAQPGTYIILQGKKLWHAFEADESGSFGDDFHEMRRVSPVLQAPLLTFGVIGPLGLLGLILSLMRRQGLMLSLFVATYALSMLPFFVAGRYRLPLVPPMIVLAAVGVAWLGDAVRRRGQRVFLVAGPGLGAVAVSFGANLEQVLVLIAALILGALASERLRPLEERAPSHRRTA